MSTAGEDVGLILIAIFLPPIAVALKGGDGVTIGINLLLTVFGWIPGVLHAWYIITRRSRPEVAIVRERPARGSHRHSRGHHGGHSKQRSRSGHRQPVTYYEPGSTRYKRTSSSSRRYYV